MRIQAGGYLVELESGEVYHSCFAKALQGYVPGNALEILEKQQIIQPVSFHNGVVYYAITNEVSENGKSSMEQSN